MCGLLSFNPKTSVISFQISTVGNYCKNCLFAWLQNLNCIGISGIVNDSNRPGKDITTEKSKSYVKVKQKNPFGIYKIQSKYIRMYR